MGNREKLRSTEDVLEYVERLRQRGVDISSEEALERWRRGYAWGYFKGALMALVVGAILWELAFGDISRLVF